ncbi:MAG: polymorphic toxin-type HINT domain-containing protein [Ignavibacteria bacterium]|nr:polymorphic toxin-type HINT domain-containing protein [Ignavibacteria bacterium]
MKESKRKLKLEDIKVESFVTSISKEQTLNANGGATEKTCETCYSVVDTACGQHTCEVNCGNTNECSAESCLTFCGSCSICPSACNTYCNCSCFLEDTLVNTSEIVLKAIQELREGDKVLSYNEITGTKLLSKVANVFISEQPYYYIINDEIKVTENHPFYVNGKWIKVKDIKKGDFLMDKELNPVEVFSIEMINQNTKVYNLEVDNIHTFFVHSILVHNKTVCSQAGSCNCPTTDSPLGGW